jgi:CHASE3 domain sensor protein
MSSRKKAKLAFGSALVLLFICGSAATITIVQLLQSAKWIAHTYDVQVSLGDIQAALSLAGRTRSNYLNSGEASLIPQYETAKTQIHRKIAEINRLTKDNPMQVACLRSWKI